MRELTLEKSHFHAKYQFYLFPGWLLFVRHDPNAIQGITAHLYSEAEHHTGLQGKAFYDVRVNLGNMHVISSASRYLTRKKVQVMCNFI